MQADKVFTGRARSKDEAVYLLGYLSVLPIKKSNISNLIAMLNFPLTHKYLTYINLIVLLFYIMHATSRIQEKS